MYKCRNLYCYDCVFMYKPSAGAIRSWAKKKRDHFVLPNCGWHHPELGEMREQIASPIPVCAMTHSHVCQDVFMCVSWLIHMCTVTHSIADAIFCAENLCVVSMCVSWLIHMYAMTYSGVWRDSFIRVPWLIVLWKPSAMQKILVTHPYMCHDSFICVPWPIHTCDMTHSHV